MSLCGTQISVRFYFGIEKGKEGRIERRKKEEKEEKERIERT